MHPMRQGIDWYTDGFIRACAGWIQNREQGSKTQMDLPGQGIYKKRRIKGLVIKRFPRRTWNYFHKENISFIPNENEGTRASNVNDLKI
jgi:hypothetical protein